MVRMFVRHNVADYPSWKQVYDSFKPTARGLGVEGEGVFKSLRNEKDVTVWHDFQSIEIAMAFMESEELRDAMDEAGVQGEPTIWFTEEG